MEEMFVIFDNEAQFTIDGRTATLKGPAGAPPDPTPPNVQSVAGEAEAR